MLDLLVRNATLPDGRSGISIAVQAGRKQHTYWNV